MKRFSVLVEADMWVEIEAETEQEAEAQAESITESNPFCWDKVRTTIMGEPEEVEEDDSEDELKETEE